MAEPADGVVTRGFVLDVATLLRRPGDRRQVVIDRGVTGLSTSAATATHLQGFLVAESMADSLSVTGTLTATWEGHCRRCLETARGTVDVDIQEVFERHPTEGETYELTDDRLDLEPMVREQVMLSLPLAPLCSEGCAGPAPDVFPAHVEDPDATDEPGDPRWAVLDELVFGVDDDPGPGPEVDQAP